MIWLIGNNGMLGSAVEALLTKNLLRYVATDRETDITDRGLVIEFADKITPKWIINCAAYTAVDKAETQATDAFRINAEGPLNLAEAASIVGARLIHISTDYVFDGAKKSEYEEDDRVNPINVYGKSKEAGEQNIRGIFPNHFIIRTSWLYGRNGNNFVDVMLKLALAKKELRVVSDQWGSPTYAPDLAQVIAIIISQNSEKFGTYHFSNEGKITWFDYAKAIVEIATKHGIINGDVCITPIATSEYHFKTPRPQNTTFSKKKIIKTFGVIARDWKVALEEYIGSIWENYTI